MSLLCTWQGPPVNPRGGSFSETSYGPPRWTEARGESTGYCGLSKNRAGTARRAGGTRKGARAGRGPGQRLCSYEQRGVGVRENEAPSDHEPPPSPPASSGGCEQVRPWVQDGEGQPPWARQQPACPSAVLLLPAPGGLSRSSQELLRKLRVPPKGQPPRPSPHKPQLCSRERADSLLSPGPHPERMPAHPGARAHTSVGPQGPGDWGAQLLQLPRPHPWAAAVADVGGGCRGDLHHTPAGCETGARHAA